MMAKEIAEAALAMKRPDNLSLIEQRLYWTLAHVYKLHARGMLSDKAGMDAEKAAVAAYEAELKAYQDWLRAGATYRLLLTSSNAECRRIAREMGGIFE